MNFDKYFTMSEADAALYAKTKLDFFGKDEELVCKEIGDGNLNYIFKIDSLSTSKSLIMMLYN
ncbi:hypothetical protein [Acetoanaerobium noterae]|uniref:hypothetical protein n=1 Tax=Acetoanaerobium noterae TaxID=745369 RepID=UPI0028A642A4|nr:hypothetical protein [Acetoanaerobium noterae]